MEKNKKIKYKIKLKIRRIKQYFKSLLSVGPLQTALSRRYCGV
jgi:hypothetical protein